MRVALAVILLTAPFAAIELFADIGLRRLLWPRRFSGRPTWWRRR